MQSISVNTMTSTTGTVAYIPIFATATTYNPPSVQVIDGLLTEGRRLIHPLTVLIEYDDEEVVVSEPRFHIHASASTEGEAITAFRRILSGYLDVLASEEETLGTKMREQLQYLRSIIKPS